MKKPTTPNLTAPNLNEVISVDPTLHACIGKVPRTVSLLNKALRAIVDAHKQTGLPIPDFDGVVGTVQDCQALFILWQRFDLRNAAVGQAFDSIIVQTWVNSVVRKYAQKLYEHAKGMIGGVRMTPETFITNADLTPFKAACEPILDFASFVHASVYEERVNPEFLRVVEIVGNHARALNDYEHILSKRLTVFCSPKQTAYLQKIKPLLDQINAIEQEFQASGLTLQGAVLGDTGYSFNKEALQRIN